MSKPSVSILMNCFNGEKYLDQAIESVLSQTYESWEVIFWDNQSTDQSAEIFKCYSDPRLKYYYAPKHTALYEARNYAIEKAAGEFVAFLDVDDWWLPDKLEMQMQRFSDRRVGVVCANYWLVNERKNHRKVMFQKAMPTGMVLNDLLKFYYPGLLTLLIRRAALTELDYIFNPRYNLIGDMELIVRLSTKWKLDYVEKPLASYRLHSNNVSLIDASRNISEMENWISEVGKVKAVSICKNFEYAKNKILYLRALQHVMSSNYMDAKLVCSKMPVSLLKLKLLAVMLMPSRMVKLIKN
jgi:glycosyltransferase involved in cell wall biosynthesis